LKTERHMLTVEYQLRSMSAKMDENGKASGTNLHS